MAFLFNLFQRTTKSLCVLNIGRNSLGADAIKALAESIECPLLSLGLQAVRMSPDAKAVVQLISGDSKLQVSREKCSFFIFSGSKDQICFFYLKISGCHIIHKFIVLEVLSIYVPVEKEKWP